MEEQADEKHRQPLLDSLAGFRARIAALEEIIAQLRSVDSAFADIQAIIAAFVDTIQAGLALVQDGHIKYVNRVGARMLGCEPEEMIGTELFSWAHPDYRKKLEARSHLMQAGDKTLMPINWPFLKKDRTVVHVRSFACGTTYMGKPAVVSFYYDVTEEKKIREELAWRAELLELLADFVFVLDARGKITYVNRAMSDAMGYSKDEMVGRNIMDFHTREHRERVNIRLKLATQASTGIYRTQYVCADGSLLKVSVRGRMIEMGGAPHVLGLARPVEHADGPI